MIHSANEMFPDNRAFFAAIKDLPLVSSDLAITVTDTNDDGSVNLEITGTTYAYLVTLSSADPEVEFDNNYFDVSPIRAVKVRVRGLGPSHDLTNVSLSAYAHGR
jgi:hypothetical protein